MVTLTGRHPCQLDSSNRLSVPAKFRDALAPEGRATLYVGPAEYVGCLLIWPEAVFAELARSLLEEAGKGHYGQEVAEYYIAHTELVKMDRQGRIPVPEMNLSEAGIEREVMLVGNLNHLQMWAEAEWDKRTRTLRARQQESCERALEISQSIRLLRPPLTTAAAGETDQPG